MEGAIDFGWIYDGDNQDSDYAGDNRALEFSRSNATTEDDNSLDISVGLGYKFKLGVPEYWQDFFTEEIGVTVFGGYSHHELNLRDTEGYSDWPPTGAFDDLDSTYATTWHGSWFGLQFDGKRDRFYGFSRIEYHIVDYYAVADWNLRTDFAHPVSFEHFANGRGIDLSFGGDYEYNDNFKFGVKFNFRSWGTGAGHTTYHYATGSIINTDNFNEAKWNSYGGMLDATYYLPIGKKKKKDTVAMFFD